MVTPPQNYHFVINHLPPCRSKPIKAWFVSGNYKKHFGWKLGGMWLSHWLPSKWHCGPEKYENLRQNTPSAISGSIIMLWSEENTFCTEIKNVFDFIQQLSRSFITLWLNHWWHKEYSGDAFHTFLDLDSVIYMTVNGTVTSLPVFIQHILNCVLKTNKAFMGLKRHGGK